MQEWTLKSSYTGFTEKAFCQTEIRVKSIEALTLLRDKLGLPGNTLVDTLSPSGDGRTLTVRPYSEIEQFAQTGDIVVFLEPNRVIDDNQTNWITAFKQRGWHNDIIIIEDGVMYQCGLWLWNSQIKRSKCRDIDPRQEWKERGQFHVFRPLAPKYDLFSEFETQIQGWARLFRQVNLPDDREHWEYDPADFFTIEDITCLATSLLKEDIQAIPPLLCVQWVHAILCLSLCVPLNEQTAIRLGVNKEWAERSRGIQQCDANKIVADSLPMQPYSRNEVMNQLALNYGGKNLNASAQDLQHLLPSISSVLPAVSTQMALLPEPCLLPIFPLWEHRNKRPSTEIEFKYIATFFPDEACEAK